MGAVERGLVMLESLNAIRLLEGMLAGTDGKLVRVSEPRFAVFVKERNVVDEIWQF